MRNRKFEDRIEQGSAKAKEWAGRVTGDRRLEREGRTQAGFAGARIKIRDAVRSLVRAFRRPSGTGYRSPGRDPLGPNRNGVNPRWRR
jgi:uncharacterized protein YjbJ (UPF0337 family)